MGEATPVVLGIAGGVVGTFFGNPMLGFSMGWMVGSWISQEPIDDANGIIDPGVQELPRINQSLRGTVIPILFGTNRVSTNLLIRSSLDVERHESRQSSGGGKGGGSGSGKAGAGAGGGGEISYTYRQDLIFSMGMVGEDVNLVGGWLGGERISGETLSQIDQGAAGANVQENVANTNASLTFDEAFFWTGKSEDEWAHGHTLTDSQAVKWPNMTGIGFKKLVLGSRPILPQLEWEVGPGAGVALTDPTSSAISKVTGARFSNKENFVLSGERDENGSIYYNNRLSNIVGCMTRSGDLIFEATDDEIMNWMEAATSQASGDHSTTFNSGAFMAPVAGGSKVAVCVRGNDGVNWMYVGIFDPITSGTPTLNGACRMRRNSVQDLKAPLALLSGGGHTVDDELWMVSKDGVANDTVQFFRFPIIGQIENTIFPTHAGAFSFECSNIKGTMPDNIGDNLADVGDYGDFSYEDNGWFQIPKIDLSLGLPNDPAYIYTYVPYGKVQGVGANDSDYAVNSLQPNFDRGVLIRFPAYLVGFGEIVTGSYSAGTNTTVMSPPEVVNSSFFVDINGGTDGKHPGYDDGRSLINSLSGFGPQWFRQASVKKLESGAYLVGWGKLSNEVSDTNSGEFMRGRARFHVYNPLADQFAHQADLGGIVYRADDWNGNFPGGADNSMFTPFYEESTSNVFVAGTLGPSGIDDVSSPAPWVNNFGQLSFSGVGEDRTIPFIVREMLRNPIFGIGVATTDIGTVGYNTANLYAEAEGFKVSCIFNRKKPVNTYIELLLAVMGGYLTINNGKIDFGVVNFGDTIVRTLDDSKFVFDGKRPALTISEGAIEDTVNHVIVKFFDRSLQYRQNAVEAKDEVDISLNGHRPFEYPPLLVMTPSVASKMADRTLHANLYAAKKLDGAVGWADADVEPGDRVWVVSSIHPTLQAGMQCRVVRKHERERGVFHLSLSQEVEYIDDIVGFDHQQTAASSTPLLGSPTPVQAAAAYELPKEFESEGSPNLYVNWMPGGPTAGANLYVSADNLSFAQAMTVSPFPIAGRLNQGLPKSNQFAENVEVYILPSSGFNTASPTYTATLQLDEVSAAGRAVGGGNIWIGSEMLAYEGVNLVAQNHYRFDRVYRGWGGTHTQDHSSGDVFFKHGGGIFIQPYNADKVGTCVYYKVVPFNFAGIETNVASITSQKYQIRGTHFAPQIAGEIHPFVGSTDYRGVNKFSTSSGDVIDFAWAESSRCSGYGAQGYGVGGGYGRFASDTISWAYAISVIGSGGNVVRTLDVSTSLFSYTHSANVADNGAFYGGFAVTVCPFNDVSSATRIAVRTLDVFEV